MSYYDYDSDRYNYKEICEKALASDATQEDINALGEWFERYGRSGWNGECWTVDAYHDLYPIHKEIGYDEYEVVGYTFSSKDEDRFIPLPFPTGELVERYSVGFKRFHSPNESSIGIGKRQQAQEDGAENAIWRRRKSIKKFLREQEEQE